MSQIEGLFSISSMKNSVLNSSIVRVDEKRRNALKNALQLNTSMQTYTMFKRSSTWADAR